MRGNYALLALRPEVEYCAFFISMVLCPPRSILFPYTTLFRSVEWWTMARRLRQRRGPKRLSFSSLASGSELKLRRFGRSEEHTSELQSPDQAVCCLLPEKKWRA